MSRGVVILCVMIGFLAGSEALSQSFTFVPSDTVLSGALGSEIVFNATITNTSTTTLVLAFVRTANDLPASWASSMCLDVCYPPTIDSIVTTSEFGSSPLNPGETRPFSVHVYTSATNGAGIVRVVGRNTHNASDQRVLTFHASSFTDGVAAPRETPLSFSLRQNYPNPWNPSTRIEYVVAKSAHVSLTVYNLLGQEIASLVSSEQQPGTYAVDFSGRHLPSGLYFYKLTAGGYAQTRTMVLTK